jgi:hypothetical protein
MKEMYSRCCIIKTGLWHGVLTYSCRLAVCKGADTWTFIPRLRSMRLVATISDICVGLEGRRYSNLATGVRFPVEARDFVFPLQHSRLSAKFRNSIFQLT